MARRGSNRWHLRRNLGLNHKQKNEDTMSRPKIIGTVDGEMRLQFDALASVCQIRSDWTGSPVIPTGVGHVKTVK